MKNTILNKIITYWNKFYIFIILNLFTFSCWAKDDNVGKNVPVLDGSLSSADVFGGGSGTLYGKFTSFFSTAKYESTIYYVTVIMIVVTISVGVFNHNEGIMKHVLKALVSVIAISAIMYICNK